MTPIDPGSAREMLEAVVTAFAVLGGSMAYFSGFYAAQALAERQPQDLVAHRVNEGIGDGFVKGVLPAVVALMIVLWS